MALPDDLSALDAILAALTAKLAGDTPILPVQKRELRDLVHAAIVAAQQVRSTTKAIAGQVTDLAEAQRALKEQLAQPVPRRGNG